MKFSIKVVSLFIVFIFIAYALPLYLDNDERIAPTSSIARNEQTAIDENEGYPLPVTGYESYIGQSITAYTAKHGQPNRIGRAYDDSEWWVSGQMLRTISRLVSRRMSSAPCIFWEAKSKRVCTQSV